MELSQLRAFVAMSETANFARAGDKLHLSAPAVFAQIRQLEDEIGEKIYTRAGKLLALTGAGEILLRHAKRILDEHDRAISAVRESRGVPHGFLRFGCNPHVSMRIAPYLLQAFLARYPEVEVENVVADYLPLLNTLREGHVDVALSTPVEDDPEFEIVRLWQHEMVLVVSSQNPLAAKKNVTPQDLRDVAFILPCTPTFREAMLRTLRSKLGVEPKVTMNHDQGGAIVELLKLGLGMSRLPIWSVAEEVRTGSLAALHFHGHRMYDEMAIYYRRTGEFPAIKQAFVEIAKDWRRWLPIARALIPSPKQDHHAARKH